MVKNLPANAGDVRDGAREDPWLGKIPWRGHGNPLQYCCLEESCGQRSLMGYSPWGGRKLGMTEAPMHAQPR